VVSVMGKKKQNKKAHLRHKKEKKKTTLGAKKENKHLLTINGF
jgi:hypothetical protein